MRKILNSQGTKRVFNEGKRISTVQNSLESIKDVILYDIDEQKISYYNHHKCHAYYSYMMCPLKDKDLLVYTMDGFGDNANGTVSKGSPGQLLNEISRSSNCNIGRLYRYATLLLGMSPAEHEYKLMGLAAYNSEKYGNEAYNVYAETLQNDGLGFKYKKEIKDHFFYFKEII